MSVKRRMATTAIDAEISSALEREGLGPFTTHNVVWAASDGELVFAKVLEPVMLVDYVLDDVPIEGTFKVVYHRFGWGDGEDFISEEVTNPTWLELAVLAERAIRHTGDYHHVFLEGARRIDDETVMLLLGS